MWFIDTPWPPIFICLLLAVLLVVRWAATHRGVFLVAAAGLLLLSAGIFFVERRIVSEAERIEAHVHSLAAAVRDDDAESAIAFFSPRADELKKRIAGAMALYDIGDDLRITDLSVEMKADDSIGISHFRANGTVTGKGSSLGGRGATRWEMTWQREAGEWKITRIVRLHPIRDGETMELLDEMN